MDHLCYLCLVFVMLLRLFTAALWSPEGKGLTTWLLFVMFIVIFFTFPFGILVWYLIVLIPDPCCLSYLDMLLSEKQITKALIRLSGCAGWSVPLLFANHQRQVFWC